MSYVGVKTPNNHIFLNKMKLVTFLSWFRLFLEMILSNINFND